MRNSKSKFKIFTHAPTNFEFEFVISNVLPHSISLNTYTHDEKVQSRICIYFLWNLTKGFIIRYLKVCKKKLWNFFFSNGGYDLFFLKPCFSNWLAV